MPTEVAPHLGGFISGPHGDEATYFSDLWRWLVERLDADRIVDVGCGEGHSTRFFESLVGCGVVGIDGVPQDDPRIRLHDFTEGPWDPRGSYDLAWCCEFVEHLEEKFLPNLVPTLQACSYVAMTHAFPGQLGHHHVNCVVEGTEVSSGVVDTAFRRRYIGKVVTLVTADGNVLTVTPNHPVATTRGWIAAGLLREGDDLIGSRFRDREPGSVMPNTYQRPASVEQVFRAKEEMSPSRVRSVPASAEQFHGDGTDGEVDVVGTDRHLLLEANASIREESRKQFLGVGHVSTALLSRKGTQLFLRVRNLPSSGGLVKDIHPQLSFFAAHPVPSVQGVDTRASRRDSFMSKNPENDGTTYTELVGEHGRRQPAQVALHDRRLINMRTKRFAPASDSQASAYEGTSRIPVIDMSLFRQASKRFPGLITTKKLTSVHLSDFVGHVYNLSTEDGFYDANGFIIHNCRDSEYWLGFMAAIGFKYERGLTQQARAVAAFNEHPLNHFVRSGLVFSRR